MQILIKMPPEQRPLDTSPDAIAEELFSIAKNAYDQYADVPDAYLHEPDATDGLAEELSLIDGAVNPEQIIQLAQNWNPTIAENFERALAAALSSQTGNGALRWLSVPNSVIYDIKKAAMALDGDVYSFAESALLITPYGYFTTRIQDEELADIIANPGNYAAITVYPK